MDSRMMFVAVAFVMVLLAVRTLRYVATRWFVGQPKWVPFVSLAAIVLCAYAAASHFNVPALVDCLQGNTLADCRSLLAAKASSQS